MPDKIYSVKELFLTLQGEGFHSGRTAVFCRFAGCNFWTGREDDRQKAICTFCDTDFLGTDGKNGGKFTIPELVARIDGLWPQDQPFKFLVCTGGEPLLQLDAPLIGALHARGFEIAVESNGSLPAPPGIDWLTISPKSLAHFQQRSGNELKLVFPQTSLSPEKFEALDFDHFYLQPMDGPNIDSNTRGAIAYCIQHPRWKLSLQTHKILGIE